MDKKIEAILDNYAIFDRIIAGIESDLILDICDERAYCRHKQLGDTGIRVRLNTITQLRDDYKIVSSRVGFLNPEDYEIYVRHLTRVRPVGELADEIGLSDDSYKDWKYQVFRCEALLSGADY